MPLSLVHVPSPDLSTLPQAEHSSILSMIGNVRTIDRYIIDYGYALELLDFVKHTPQAPPEWGFIARRDATMNVWHINKVYEKGFNTELCQEFARRFGVKAFVKHARRMLRDHFKHIDDARDVVGHSGERRATHQAVVKNSMSKRLQLPGISIHPESKVTSFVENSVLADGLMYSTHKPVHSDTQIIHSDLSPVGLDALIKSRNHVADNFKKIAMDLAAKKSTP